MKNWFEVKLKYAKVTEDGTERVATETFVFDAVSFTDAETRVTKEAKRFTKGGEFVVIDIKRSQLQDIYPYENGEWWFKAKLQLVTVDEEAGKEKKLTMYNLVQADDLKEAMSRLEESLEYLIIPYSVKSLSETNIADVYPYDKVSEIL